MFASDTTDIWIAIIGSAPELLALTVLGSLAMKHRHEIGTLVKGLTSVKAGPIEFGFDAKGLAAAKPGLNIPESTVGALELRVARIHKSLEGSRVLWVDDHPATNSIERKTLRSLKAEVHTAVDSAAARSLLTQDDFDLLITDQNRGSNPTAGTDLVADLFAEGLDIPTIGYVGFADPSRGTPPHYHSFTDRPDDLLHAVLDIMERRE